MHVAMSRSHKWHFAISHIAGHRLVLQNIRTYFRHLGGGGGLKNNNGKKKDIEMCARYCSE